MNTIYRKKMGALFFAAAIFVFYIIININIKADFIIEAENYKPGDSVGYYDSDIVNRGGVFRVSEGVDIYDMAGINGDVTPAVPESGSYRVSYIESGEWISYQKNIPAGDAGNEAGIYKVYLRVAANRDGNSIKLMSALNGGPVQNISTVNFDRTGTFSNKEGAVWKDIELGAVVLKEGENLLRLDFITGVQSDWEYGINYLKFVKQPTVKVDYNKNGVIDSMFLSFADYNKMSKTSEINPVVLGDVEEATVNGSQEIRGYVWNLNDSTKKYTLDIEICNADGTLLIVDNPATTDVDESSVMRSFAIASEQNPAVTYPTWDLRTMISLGVFPVTGDYHGFSLGKKAILEHAQLRFSINETKNVYIKIVPKVPTGAETLFNDKMIVGTIIPLEVYDKSVTIDKTDMSEFPKISVYFTTIGIESIVKLGGTTENGEVNELSNISAGAGEVVGISDLGESGAFPIDIVIAYEKTNSMNSAALTKIKNTVNTMISKGFNVKVKYIEFDVGSGNTGIWEKAKDALWNAIEEFPLERSPLPVVEPEKWIVLAAAANGYEPDPDDVKNLADRMLRDKIMFTVVDQDTGNNITNDINHTFLNVTNDMEGIRYYSGHLGVGKTGEYMLDTANLYILGKIKKWKVVYNSPIPERDGTERRKNFIVIDETGDSHGPAISYYRAPRYGGANQTIIMTRNAGALLGFDLMKNIIGFTDGMAGADYEALKYVNSSTISSIEDYSYNEERHFSPVYNTTNAVYTNEFIYTGLEEKNFVLINKTTATDGLGVRESYLKNGEDNDAKLYYTTNYTELDTPAVNGETSEFMWKKNTNGYSGELFTSEEVMVRVIKNAYSAEERYNVFDKDNINQPIYAGYNANVYNSVMSDFVTNQNRKYIDFRFDEKTDYDLKFTERGIEVKYEYQNSIYDKSKFTVKGLPASNSYTVELYTIKNIGGIYKIITYEGSKILPVVNIDINIDILTPETNGTFKYSIDDITKVIVRGKVRSVETRSDRAAAEYKKPEVKVTVYKHGESVQIKDADIAIIEGVYDENGYYTFTAQILEKTLSDTGAEKFDVKAEGVYETKKAEDLSLNIGLDAGAPKIINIKMINLTVMENLKKMMLSDGGGNVFSDTEAGNLSTIEYILNNETDYRWGIIGNVNFESRSEKSTKDGRFVKNEDEIEITAVIMEENFDMTKLNIDSNKNVIRASFEGLNLSGYIAPTEVTYEGAVGTGIKITAVWRFKVQNTSNQTAIMKLRAIDALENSSEAKLSDIEIAIVDNAKPGNPVMKISKLERTESIGITNIDYQINGSGDNLIDENGIRVYKVLYSYDPVKSDWGREGRTDTGNHDNDRYDGYDVGAAEPGINESANRYFYIKAGDGINLIDEVNQATEGIGIKILRGRYDDGLYSRYRVVAVDKAGNETETATNELSLIVDTVPPRINSAVVKKIADRDGFIPKDANENPISYPDNLIKAGDTARIEYSVIDFNVSENVTENTVTYYDAGYQWMINNNVEIPEVVLGSIAGLLTYEDAINRKGYEIDVKIGEGNATYKNSSAETPNIKVISLNNGAMPTTIIAKDLAGNIGTVTISPELDNTAPAKVTARAYAYERFRMDVNYYSGISESIKNIYNQEPENGIVHITRGGNDKNDFFIKLGDLSSDAVYYTLSLGSIESAKKDLLIPGTEYIQLSSTHTTTDFMPLYGLNTVYIKVRDLAGNISELSNGGNIVLDTMVGNRNTVTAQQGGTVKLISGGYEFSIKLSLPEYAGIKEIIPKKISNGTILKEITGVAAVAVDQTPSSIEQTKSIDKKMIFTKSQIPAVIRGTRATVTFLVTDNLGNEQYFNINYLIPKEGLEIKAQQEGSEKETRTKIKVVGENEFELQKSEEGGKSR